MKCFVNFGVLFCCAILPLKYAQMAGGLGETKTPASQDEQIVKDIISVKDAFAAKTGITPKEFAVISYASQVVAGTNYFAKVRIDSDTYVHVRVFKPLPYLNKEPELTAVQMDKKLDDPITYFKRDSSDFNGTLAGGIGQVVVPTSQEEEDVMKITANSVQEAFVAKTGVTPKEFFVVKYATQVVAGTNYFAKIRIARDKYAHIRVFVALPHENKQPELHAVQMGKSLTDPIEFFSQDSGIESSANGNIASTAAVDVKLMTLVAFCSAFVF